MNRYVDHLPPDELRQLLRTNMAYARQAAKARADLALFIEAVVKDDHAHQLQLAPIHHQWIHHVRYCWSHGLKAMILAPFGHGKSSTLAVPLIAHAIGNDTNYRVKVVTNDDDSATKRVQRVKEIVESISYQAIFPNVRRGKRWTGHEMYLERSGHAIDPSVHARGVETKGIGGRADLIVFDDAVDQKNAMDQSQRKKILGYIESTWLSRLEPDGKVLYIGTPWHLDDATHHLMQRQGWCTLVQKVSQGCDVIEQELIGAVDPASYPIVQAPAVEPFVISAV